MSRRQACWTLSQPSLVRRPSLASEAQHHSLPLPTQHHTRQVTFLASLHPPSPAAPPQAVPAASAALEVMTPLQVTSGLVTKDRRCFIRASIVVGTMISASTSARMLSTASVHKLGRKGDFIQYLGNHNYLMNLRLEHTSIYYLAILCLNHTMTICILAWYPLIISSVVLKLYHCTHWKYFGIWCMMLRLDFHLDTTGESPQQNRISTYVGKCDHCIEASRYKH